MERLFDDIPLPETSTTSTKAETPVIPFKGKPVDSKIVAACVAAGTEPPQPVTIERYLSLLDEQEQVVADIKACEAEIRPFGLTETMAFNCASQGLSTLSSIQLVDGLRPGTEVDPETPAVRFTLVNRYTPNLEAVTAWFADRKTPKPTPGAPKPPTINDVLMYTVDASFDSNVFNDENGKYSAERFNAFQAALNQVCETYGVQNPLSVTKKLAVKPDFHEKRWRMFTAEENASLHAVLSCGTQLAPVRPKRKKVSRRPSATKK